MAQGREQQAAPASVRSFLVADIRGYTSYTAAHGDEAAARLVEHFAGLVSDGVAAWSGTLVELRGDEALAAFESPRSALRAAAELQAAFADESREHPDLPLSVGIGLDAGEAVPVGDGYRGAALNRAARLCSAAAAAETLASEELIHLAGPISGIDYAPPRQVKAKGLDEPVGVVAVSAAQDEVHDTGPAATLGTPTSIPPQLDPVVPLAGRQSELAWLRWHWRRARHGHARTVVISGIPGIGKTRLAAAVAAVVHGDGGAITYLPTATGISEAALATRAHGGPALLVVDDIDAAPTELVQATVDEATALAGPVLLLVTHRTEASTGLLQSLEGLTPSSMRRELGPLELDAVRMIASLYAGEAVDALPLADIAEQTDGHPASVHRVAHEWARRMALQRVGSSAGRAESGRRDLQAAEADLIADIGLLEQAREGGLLYDDRHDLAGADADERSRPRSMCPYKGLEPYESRDADLFFGRERLVAELTARLVGSPFLAVVGASGSGKSSVIGAGLLPSLAAGALPGSDAWPQVSMRPGERPATALSRALCQAFEGLCDGPVGADEAMAGALAGLPSGGRLVLFIDQFEEVFASEDAAERAAFIDTICREHPGLLVIVALRADHYGHAAAFPTLARQLASHHVLVGTLTRQELVAVIERPAERVGLHVEPGLVDALVADAGTEPSVLPLLSTALLESWTLRDGNRLTLAAYQAGGGLHGSVARLAEGVWTSLDPDRQAVARAILLRLAGSSEAEGFVRRRVPLAEFDLEDDQLGSEVLERLVSARLLTTEDGTVEVTHEALLREWPRLREWLEDDATGHQLHMHLAAAARAWDTGGRPASDLYRGARLGGALEWSAEHPEQLNALEREFLEASSAAADAEVERQRKTNRNLRVLVAGIGVLLLAAVGAGVFAALEANRAEEEAAQADRERLAARASELVASSVAELGFDPGLSKLLALQAEQVDPNPDPNVLAGLHTVLAADKVTHRVPIGHPETGELSWANVDPNGRWMVTTGTRTRPRPEMAVFDLASETVDPVWTYEAPPGALVSLPRFTPDGDRLVAGIFAFDDPDAETSGPLPADELGIGIWQAPPEGATEWTLADWIVVGRCGARLEDASDRNALIQVPSDPDNACFDRRFSDFASIELVDFDGHLARPLSDAFRVAPPADLLSADGRTLAYTSGELGRGDALVIDTETMATRWSDDPEETWPLAVSADGSTMLARGSTGLEVWDVDADAVIASHALPGGIARGQFHPSDELVLSTGSDAALTLWDARTGEDLGHYPATGRLWPQFFGERMVVVDDAGDVPALLVVDPRPRGEPLAVDLCAGIEDPLAEAVLWRNLDAAGEGLLLSLGCETAWWEGGADTLLVDASSGAVTLAIEGQAGQQQAVSPDGRYVARQDGPTEGRVAIRDLESGAVQSVMDPACLGADEPDPDTGCPMGHVYMYWMEWGDDGRLLAGGGDDHVAVWDTTSGQVMTVIPPDYDEGSFAWHGTLSPDGTQLIVMRVVEPEQAAPTGWLDVYSTETWELERSTAIDPGSQYPGMAFIGWAPDGSTVYGRGGSDTGSGNETLVWIDATSLERQGPVVRLHDASTLDTAMSPDGRRLATTSGSGEVRVWDLTDRELIHEIQFRFIDPSQGTVGVAWTDDSSLAVVTESGLLVEFTTDAAELTRLVRESLTRGLTTNECTRYEVDPCPSLEDMRDG